MVIVPDYVRKWCIPSKIWTIRKDAPANVIEYCKRINERSMELKGKPHFHFEGEED